MYYLSIWIFSFLLPATENLTKDEYYLLFSKIDNRVEVYADDSLIFESGFIEGNPDLAIRFDFDPKKLKARKLKVVLLNGEDVDVEQIDRHWEITYEIFRNDEPIEYQSESADNYETGMVFSMSYNLRDL